MIITERRVADIVVLDVAGSIAGRKAAALIDTIVRRHARTGTRIIVANLARVPAIDLAGLGALVDAYITMHCARGTFRLARLAKQIHDLVVITRLVTVIDIFDALEDALGVPAPAEHEITQAARLATTSLAPIQRFLRRA
jgi:anti-anti-sigma factor